MWPTQGAVPTNSAYYWCMVQQARAHATREQLLDAAAILFGRHGYGAGIADIARTAGVNKGSLYFHFESKEHLAHEIIRLQHERSTAVDDSSLQNSPPIVRMIAITLRLARQALEEPTVKAGLRLTLDSSSFEVAPREPFTYWIQRFTELLEQAVDDGLVTSRVPPSHFARIAVSIYTGAQLVLKSLGQEEEFLTESVSDAWNALLPALLITADEQTISAILEEAMMLGERRTLTIG
ncbi:TetR family transcriptional regulator [Rathayibacter iranicus]|uniref:TetR/AcrR family transcriptional regulator n=3 Tax=Rathayibacter iranicus TaxID=59737 RepID=A0AAD1AC90_9MICO|nr:TetR/AcrR family transcriptional regulator [Rathayibacter iranicus]PPI48263.1 TetR family transcriptional regulator [Rathayibacter iranicus]PPI60894.1 TetR family transcriptional regulator [Rathayibacter iranicus]PPI72578.1 TetR family transcriptional regulator [Rathayibacter iranicus]PWJ63276.1 TetR family transcriptional regulator [Rathayibacter iranicus NCPPB 2253 = VKM Ac-1602]